MNNLVRFVLLAGMVAALATPQPASADSYGTRVIDPMYKVLPEADIDSFPTSYAADVARGEYATWLVLLRNSSALSGLSVSVTTPSGSAGSLPQPRIRVVGTVPVSTFEKKPSKEALRPTTGLFPDPLYETVPTSLAAGELLQLWIDVQIPDDAAAGTYTGKVTINGSGGFSQQLPLKVTVYGVTVGKPSFWLSQTFNTGGIGISAGPKSTPAQQDAFLARLKIYAEDLASHGERVLRVDPMSWVTVKSDGSYDFSFFDRYVQVFRDAGSADRIQGGFLGTRSGAWESDYDARVGVPTNGVLVVKKEPADSDDAKHFFASYLPALVNHLKDKGWLGDYIQNIADEPIPENVESWKKIKAYHDEYEQGVTTTDCEPERMVADLVDINCPILESLEANFNEWKPIIYAPGRNFWFYVANSTQGEFANRFIDQPLMKTRVIPWIGFSCGAKGFVHWGYNSWYATKDAFHNLTPPGIPAGDGWIVYPGSNGPIDSIRWEATRDGMDDYALLTMAASKDATATRGLVKQIVKTFKEYEPSLTVFRQVRRQLLVMDAG